MVTLGEDSILVVLRRAGAFSEILPLLVSVDGNLVSTPGAVTLKTQHGNFQISFRGGNTTTIAAPSVFVLKKRVVVTLHAEMN